MKRFSRAVLRLTLLLLSEGTIMTASSADALPGVHTAPVIENNTLDARAWVISAEGQTLLRPFRNAPFPHVSRDKGFTYEGKFFDSATHYSDSTVGIFIPVGYQSGETVDYVVHFHGWSNHVENVLAHYALRRQLVASGRNAILLIPQGPKDATDSGGGRLEMEPEAFAALIAEVTQFLQQAGKLTTNRIGQIVLSTHSGGYRVTSAILAQGGLTGHITDVLLFDSSYGGLEVFADWAARGRGHRLISLFTDHLAADNFTLLTLLQKRHVGFQSLLKSDLDTKTLLPRHVYFLHTPDLPHDEVMQKRDYFTLFLQTSALGRHNQ